MTTTTYVDVNLHDCQVTGRAVTVCLHIVNVTFYHCHTKGNPQLKLQLLALNLWQPELLQIKSLTSGTLSCILESQSDPKATCLVIANLLLAVQAYPPPLCPRNQLWLHTIEPEKPLLQDKSNPADILSKHWELANIWPLLKPLLFGVTHMSSLPRQRRATEFQSKRGSLSLTLMDQ